MTENASVLVCVTDQASCSRLIEEGRALALEEGLTLRVLHVRTRENTMMGNPDISSALNDLYLLARQAEAEMEIISSQQVEDTICDYAAKHRAKQVVVGESPKDRRPDMASRLSARLPGAKVHVVRG